MLCRERGVLALSLILTLGQIPTALAQMGGRKGMLREAMQNRPSMSDDGVEQLDHAIVASGLTVVFPEGFACPAIASPYASRTRHDGSVRRMDRNGGLHGGMDISLNSGTPLLAQAAGEVIALGAGGRLEGNFIWLRHAPAETGLPFWVFAKYQHLSELPTLKVGDRVRAGQVIGLSGATGTVNPVWPSGYPHLHLTTFFGPSAEFSISGAYASQVKGQGAVIDDPLIVYLQSLADLSEVRQLSEARRQVKPAVITESGTVPEGSKTVWPVVCKRQ